MKKVVFLLGMMVVTMGLFTTKVIAQTTAGEAVTYSLPAMKLLAVEGDAPSLTFVTPAYGAAIADATSSGSWLNYTSVIDSTITNKIQVIITGTVPAGTTLKVAAATATTGNGTLGSSPAAVTLSTTDQDLITGIGSCYTGAGPNLGANLTYTWSVTPTGYASLRSTAAADINVTYTIAADI